MSKSLVYAGPVVRSTSYFVDITLCFFAKLGLNAVFFGQEYYLNGPYDRYFQLAFIFYQAFFVSLFGATVANMLFGYRIQKINGKNMSFLEALSWILMEYLNKLTLGYGYISCFFSPQRQMLHDKLADCVAISKFGVNEFFWIDARKKSKAT